MSGVLKPYSEELRAALIAAQAYSFVVPAETVPAWLARAGHENTFAWCVGSELAGGLIIIPMGIWFGGRSVKNLGVAGVAIAPEHRGRGHGYAMMTAMLRDARRAGHAVSTLFPATISLYRKCGYELAGGYYSIRHPLSAFSAFREKDGEIVPVGEADVESLSALQRPIARANDGNLDRGPYIWNRVFAPRLQPARGFGVRFDGKLEGYVFLKATTDRNPPFHDLSLSDLVARTPRAMRRLLSFLADHRSLAEHATWFGDPHDRFLAAMSERAHQIALHEHWMLRILDPKAALESRGYRVERGSVELELEDPELTENRGRIRVEVEDGRAHVVAPKGGPVIKTHVRGLAAMYSGFQTASALAESGWIAGDEAALEAADRLFAGRTPWIGEMF